MDKELIYKLFKDNIEKGKVLIDEPMKKHTSFKIGGPVDILVIPGNLNEIVGSVRLCKEKNIEFKILGNGSNLLVRDKGIRGVIIKIADNFNNIDILGEILTVESGALLSTTSKFALKNSLAGFEFAGGIPGTIGGAVTMNAGAYGGEMKNVVEKVKCIDKNGEIVEFNNKEMDFGYRQSRVAEEDLIVLEVELKLEKADYDYIKDKMDDLNKKRTTKQPLTLPSGGSTFKRPEGYYAAKLIEDSGLKGRKVGDAQVSEKHAGFVVNVGNATCEDVLGLVDVVKEAVMDKFNVELEMEVKIVGEV